MTCMKNLYCYYFCNIRYSRIYLQNKLLHHHVSSAQKQGFLQSLQRTIKYISVLELVNLWPGRHGLKWNCCVIIHKNVNFSWSCVCALISFSVLYCLSLYSLSGKCVCWLDTNWCVCVVLFAGCTSCADRFVPAEHAWVYHVAGCFA